MNLQIWTQRPSRPGYQALFHRKQWDRGSLSRSTQISVERGKWNVASTGELQVGSIVNRQVCLLSDGKNSRPSTGSQWQLYLNRQRTQRLFKLEDLLKRYPFSAKRHYQAVHDLGRPVRRNDGFVARIQTIQKSFSCRCGLVRKAPRQCSRSVHYEAAQYFRPSLTNSLMERPPSDKPLRNSRIQSTASFGVMRLAVSGSSATRRSSARSTISSGGPAWARRWSSSSAWGVRVTVMSLNVARPERPRADGDSPDRAHFHEVLDL